MQSQSAKPLHLPIQELKQRVLALLANRINLQEQINGLISERNIIQQDLARFRAELDRVYAQHQELSNQRDNLIAAIEQMSTNRDLLQAEIDKFASLTQEHSEEAYFHEPHLNQPSIPLTSAQRASTPQSQPKAEDNLCSFDQNKSLKNSSIGLTRRQNNAFLCRQPSSRITLRDLQCKNSISAINDLAGRIHIPAEAGIANFYLSELSYLMTLPPKSGCTSIKTIALKSVCNYMPRENESLAHLEMNRFSISSNQIHELISEHILSNTGISILAFIRNPIKRVFSAWQSKILLREPSSRGIHGNWPYYHFPLNSMEDISAAFEDFLNFLSTNPNAQDLLKSDSHFIPFSRFLLQPLELYDEIIDIDNMGDAEIENLNSTFPKIGWNEVKYTRLNSSLLSLEDLDLTGLDLLQIKALYERDFEIHKFTQAGNAPMLHDENETKTSAEMLRTIKAIKKIRTTNNYYWEEIISGKVPPWAL